MKKRAEEEEEDDEEDGDEKSNLVTVIPVKDDRKLRRMKLATGLVGQNVPPGSIKIPVVVEPFVTLEMILCVVMLILSFILFALFLIRFSMSEVNPDTFLVLYYAQCGIGILSCATVAYRAKKLLPRAPSINGVQEPMFRRSHYEPYLIALLKLTGFALTSMVMNLAFHRNFSGHKHLLKEIEIEKQSATHVLVLASYWISQLPAVVGFLGYALGDFFVVVREETERRYSDPMKIMASSTDKSKIQQELTQYYHNKK